MCLLPLGFQLMRCLPRRRFTTRTITTITATSRLGRITETVNITGTEGGEGAGGEDGEAEEVGGEVVVAGFSNEQKILINNTEIR